MTVLDAFSSSSYSSTGTPFYINLGGFKNPKTLATTSTFTITTKDASGVSLETITTGVTTQMTSNPELTSFTVT